MKYWTLAAFVIAGCFFLAYPAAAPGGYTFSPLGDPPPEGGNDFTEISFWELPPRMMLVEMLLFISPVLLFPAELLYSFTAVTFLGYRRILRRNALDHDSRKRLYECIGQNPGTSLGALIQASGVTRGAAQYHLCRLKSMGMIVAVRQGGQVGYFKTGEGSGAVGRSVHLHLQNDTTRQIFSLLLEDHRPSQRDLAVAVGISAPSAFWYMRRLIADGIIEPHREGKTMRYCLTPEALGLLREETTHDSTDDWGSGDGEEGVAV